MENTPVKSEGTPTVTSNNETATSSTENNSSTMAVTSSNGNNTSQSPAFHSLEQLHEAVLAAVNSHNMPPGFIAAAAAAAAAAANASDPQQQQQQQQQQQRYGLNQQQQLEQQQDPNTRPRKQQRTHQPLSEMDIAKKESIRASNRERKKKWRIHNEERNKDNDLRCRVNKRANKLYGLADSEEKQRWIKEEFEKRRLKRMEKERRKHIVNNVLSVPSPTSTGSPATTTNDMLPGAAPQLSAYYSPLPQIDNATASKLLDFPADLQRQLLEQLNNSMLALTNGIQSSNTAQPESNDNNNNDNDNSNNDTNENKPASVGSGSPAESNEVTSNTEKEHKMESSTELSQIKEELTEGASKSENALAAPSEEKKEVRDKKEGSSNEEKKPEYPMDAVLSLMQLNAAWRQ
ncbi:hypothetical protein G6F70_004811 [Rhizopus microsporus]|uniref:DUF3020 domain-containing protein n=2 Tax=Rhizopus TaxID=4842 RepID=A0A367KCD5_RHIAZ|nr:hypothetical protein G6F71_006460 [Rhizopus microsporus]RCH99865.1 hypothetical protein CU097_006499 [Rhizopus azygosporus]KAG1199571.1 hypothetical protein G6F70_004811 [Rhizopus microsporus]KAG1209592.1 hypothetical protein G6F69_006213 [Rhizopus microsporus]KAG1231029.1 hypothetical protein G6F67_006041 [Rhizopus microsporus]